MPRRAAADEGTTRNRCESSTNSAQQLGHTDCLTTASIVTSRGDSFEASSPRRPSFGTGAMMRQDPGAETQKGRRQGPNSSTGVLQSGCVHPQWVAPAASSTLGIRRISMSRPQRCSAIKASWLGVDTVFKHLRERRKFDEATVERVYEVGAPRHGRHACKKGLNCSTNVGALMVLAGGLLPWSV